MSSILWLYEEALKLANEELVYCLNTNSWGYEIKSKKIKLAKAEWKFANNVLKQAKKELNGVQ